MITPASTPSLMHEPAAVHMKPVPHSLPVCVHEISHLPSAVQWKPPGQAFGEPSAGSQVVLHAAGGGTMATHRLSPGVFFVPQAVASNASPSKKARVMT